MYFRPVSYRYGAQLLSGTSLADARLVHQHDQPPGTRKGVVQSFLQLGQLPLVADE